MGAPFNKAASASLRQTKWNTKMLKGVWSFFLAFMALSDAFAARYVAGNSTEPSFAVVGSVSVYLAVVLFFLVFMGLQMTTTFVSAKIIETLNPLPLTRKDLSDIGLLTFVRIFDAPMVVALIVFPIGYIFFTGSILGGLILILGIVVTEAYALALVLALARFFQAKIATVGGSAWRSALRVVYMLLWILPTFGTYLLMNFASRAPVLVSSVANAVSSATILVVAYPFSLGFLVSQTVSFQLANSSVMAASLAATLCYVALGAYAVRWAESAIRKIPFSIGGTITSKTTRGRGIIPRAAWIGVTLKDLRIASRTPSYFSILMLPTFQTIILAILPISEGVGLGEIVYFGLIIYSSIMVILIPASLYSMEAVGSAYTRTLPIRRRSLLVAKTLVALLSYLVSLIAIGVLFLILKKEVFMAMELGIVQILPISAASIIRATIQVAAHSKQTRPIGISFFQHKAIIWSTRKRGSVQRIHIMRKIRA